MFSCYFGQLVFGVERKISRICYIVGGRSVEIIAYCVTFIKKIKFYDQVVAAVKFACSSYTVLIIIVDRKPNEICL